MIALQKSNSCPVNITISPQKFGKTVSMIEKHQLLEYATIDDTAKAFIRNNQEINEMEHVNECQDKAETNKALNHHYEAPQSKNRLDILKIDARNR